jgi:hypothetical protein
MPSQRRVLALNPASSMRYTGSCQHVRLLNNNFSSQAAGTRNTEPRAGFRESFDYGEAACAWSGSKASTTNDLRIKASKIVACSGDGFVARCHTQASK